MNLQQAQARAEHALTKGQTLYFYRARNGQWMADGSKNYGQPPFYDIKEFLAVFCRVKGIVKRYKRGDIVIGNNNGEKAEVVVVLPDDEDRGDYICMWDYGLDFEIDRDLE